MEVITQRQDMKGAITVALGYFDGMHRGHAAVIGAAVRDAREHNTVPALMTFDMTARRADHKGALDLMTPEQKRAAAKALGVGRYIELPFAEIAGMSGEDFFGEILLKDGHAAGIVCGADFRFGAARSCGVAQLEAMCRDAAVRLIVAPAEFEDGQPVSTTRIKAAIQAGDVALAARLLGHAYGFVLPVYEEKHLARRLGFPTINQRFPQRVLPPRLGVYHTRAEVQGAWYAAVSNVGTRPTVEGEMLSLETHLLDFDGDLYGREVPVEFLRFLRDERRFEDIGALRAAVEADIAAVRAAM